MMLKIVTVVLLSMCAAEIQILFPKRASAQALSSNRYNRQDMPLPFKYGHVHHYSTASPVLRPVQQLPNLYQGIQYAPLQGRIAKSKNKNAAAEYTKVTPTISSTATTQSDQRNRNGYAKHLEPRVATEARDPSYKCYNSGHNVEVLSSVSRSPGHNAVYRSFPAPVQRDKPFKVNNMRPYGVYNLDALKTTLSPFEVPHQNPPPFTFTNEHYVINPNIIGKDGPEGEKIKRQYSPYAKFHRLHLNIARVYSPGQVPQKPPVFADTYSLNLAGLPVQSQAYLPPIFQALTDHKTLLYPKDSQRKYHFRLP